MDAEKLIKKITKIANKYFKTKSLEDLSDEDLELWFNNFDVFRKYNEEYFEEVYWENASISTTIVAILWIIAFFISLISLGLLYTVITNFFNKIFTIIAHKHINNSIKDLYKEMNIIIRAKEK